MNQSVQLWPYRGNATRILIQTLPVQDRTYVLENGKLGDLDDAKESADYEDAFNFAVAHGYCVVNYQKPTNPLNPALKVRLLGHQGGVIVHTLLEKDREYVQLDGSLGDIETAWVCANRRIARHFATAHGYKVARR